MPYNPNEPRNERGEWTAGGPALPQAVIDFEREHTDPRHPDKVEKYVLVAKDGSVVARGEGGTTWCAVEPTDFDVDATLTHVHPPVRITEGPNPKIVADPQGISGAPSISDLTAAIDGNYYQVRTCGLDHGQPIVYTLTQPEEGWPPRFEVERYYKRQMTHWVTKLNDDPNISSKDEFVLQVQAHVWENMAEHFNLGYQRSKLRR